MINLSDLQLKNIAPSSILQDSDIDGLMYALDRQMQQITQEIINVVLLPRIDELDEDVIDFLAWQLHVDFYEPLGLDLNMKRALVKNSIGWHRRKGTKSVIREILRTLSFGDCEVEEWFEYGGEPFFFRITSDTLSVTNEKLYYMIAAATSLKNVRSWLEKIKIYSTFPDVQFYTGHLTETFDRMSIGPKPVDNVYKSKEIFRASRNVLAAVKETVPVKYMENGQFHNRLSKCFYSGTVEIIQVPVKYFDEGTAEHTLFISPSAGIQVMREAIPEAFMKEENLRAKGMLTGYRNITEYLEIPVKEGND